jgi:hypothetical protein
MSIANELLEFIENEIKEQISTDSMKMYQDDIRKLKSKLSGVTDPHQKQKISKHISDLQRYIMLHR